MGSFRVCMHHALILLSLLGVAAKAQTTPSGSLTQQLSSKYALTKATAARDDIVTAGDVIVLQKDKLLMCATTNSLPTQNTYKGGKIQQSVFSVLGTMKVPGQTPSLASRTYVTGEKFWITAIDQKDDGILFTVMSDPVGDTRFYGTLKFPFPKGSPPPPDRMLATVAEVFTVQPADNASAKDNGAKLPAVKQPPAAPPAPAPAAMADIPPPPPPPDAAPPAPPTIALGQTKDQVIAMFGNPTRILDKGLTKVYVYPDMKVTFVKDKVTNIQ